MARECIPVSGIWLCRRGDECEVLAEVDGRWLTVIKASGETISEIVEPSGIKNSKPPGWLSETEAA